MFDDGGLALRRITAICIRMLDTTTSYFPRKYREAIEIQKHSDNLNRDNGYNISKI